MACLSIEVIAEQYSLLLRLHDDAIRGENQTSEAPSQGSGQVLINTSATGLRPARKAALYSATRAGANTLIRCAGLSVADKGVTVNAAGTYAMDQPSFIEDVGADDPSRRSQVEATIPMRRFGKPEEAAHFVATLIDGVGTFQTVQFFSIGGGWAFKKSNES